MKHRVICIQPIHPEGMKILQSRPDIELIVPENPEPAAWANFLPGTKAICVRLSKITRELMEKAPELQLISRHGVGCDNIDVEAATDRGVIVATIGEANAPSVVEHTLMLMLALAKRLFDRDREVRNPEGYMRKLQLDAQDLSGRTVLIIGLGRIGSRLSKALGALGMRCLGTDPAYSPEQIKAMGCEPVTDFREALPRADFVTVHTPLQTDTRNMIGARELSMMKPSAYLINCARGGIVDEAALIKALDSRQIMGAGFDVQVEEPPRPDDPLLACGRVILTPHAASSTAETVMRSAMTVAQNVLDHIDGRLPKSHVFNPEVLKKLGNA